MLCFPFLSGQIPSRLSSKSILTTNVSFSSLLASFPGNRTFPSPGAHSFSSVSTLRTYHTFLWSHLSHSLCSSYLRGRSSLTPVPTMGPGFSFVSPMATQHVTEPTKRSITQQLRHWLSHSINDWILGRKYLRNVPEDLEMFSGK